MPGRTRDIQLKIFISSDEKRQIKENMTKAGVSNMSAYVRKMLIDGRIIQIDLSEFKELNRNLGMIGNNINQIAKNINAGYDLDNMENMEQLLYEWQDFKKYYEELVSKLANKSKYGGL